MIENLSPQQQAIAPIRTLAMDAVQAANSGHPGTPMALAPAEGKSVGEIYEALTLEDIRRTADLLRPVYEQMQYLDGYVSLVTFTVPGVLIGGQVGPWVAHRISLERFMGILFMAIAALTLWGGVR